MDTDLLVDFLNTLDEDSGKDDLADDAAAAAWFTAHALPASGVSADEARRVRGALRSAANGIGAVHHDLALVPLHAGFDDDGHPVLTSDHPLGPIVVVAVRLAYEGQWDRLKLCGLDTCRYAFFDGSRNRSGRWCSMAVCGNRAKTRAFRDRHRKP